MATFGQAMDKTKFTEEAIEILKKNSVFEFYRAKRRAEFLKRLKEGKRYGFTDDPGPF